MSFEFDDQGELADFFYSGGREGFSRPDSGFGSVDENGNASWTLTFGSVTENWSGKITNFAAAGSYIDFNNGNCVGATWRAARGTSELPPSYAEIERQYADPIDTATGAFTARHVWLKQSTPTDLKVQIEYSSSALETGRFGVGWGHNYEARIDVIDATELAFNWTQQRRNRFKRVGSSTTFTSSDRAMRYDTITKNGNGSFSLKRADQSRMEFASNGRLNQIVNPQGQALNLTYSFGGLLTQVADAVSGRDIHFEYDSESRVAFASDASDRYLTFTYDTSDHLIRIALLQAADANTPPSDDDKQFLEYQYTYDSVGRILAATDGNGTQYVTNTYDSSGRVATQEDARTDNKKATFSYDESVPGELNVRVTDRNGKPLAYRYDQELRLLSLRNQNGETTSSTYDPDSNRTSSTSGVGETTHYSFDVQGNITSVTDHYNRTKTMTYDSRNNLTQSTDEAGKNTIFGYDANNNLTSVKNPLNQTVSFTYNASSLLTRRTSARSGSTDYTYTNGLATSVKDPNNLTTLMSYDVSGRLTGVTDPAGKTTAMAYNAIDDVVRITDPRGKSVSFTFDTRHRKLSETNPLGQTSGWAYDGNGNVLTRTDALKKVTKFTYDGEDRLATTTDSLGKKTAMSYDAAGRLIGITDGAGKTRSMQHDAEGNVTTMTDARGFSSKMTYLLDLLVTTTDPLDRVSTFSYDARRDLVESTNPMGQASGLGYDDIDRLVAFKDPMNQYTHQAFDGDGNRSSITNARNAATSFAFDLGQRLTSTTTAGGRATSFSYNSRNLPATIVEPSTQTTTLTYDDARRLTRLVDPVGQIDYTYDDANRLLTVASGGVTISREYDAVGRMTKFTDGDGNVILYAFDAVGNLIKLTYPDGKSVSYAYDAANRLSSVIDWKKRKTLYAYDPDGRLISTTRPNGTVETRAWNEAGELAEIVDSKGAVIISAFHFTRDPAGRIVAEHPEPIPGDFLPASFTAAYDTDNRLTSFNGAAISYDADGNMTTGPVVNGSGNATYSYDARNRLTSFGGLSYGYDAEDRRISLTDATGTTRFVINPGAPLSKVLVRTAPDGKVTRAVYGLGLLYEETDSDLRYFHYDFRGSAVAFTDAGGSISGRAEYGPYGELAATSGSAATPFLFNGKYGVMTDSTGLYQMRARYYNPRIKRFVNQDALLGSIVQGAGLNRYAYANLNPVSLTDPLGLEASDDSDSSPLQLNDRAEHERLKIFRDAVKNSRAFAEAFKRYFGSRAFRDFNYLTGKYGLNRIGDLRGMVLSAKYRSLFDRLTPAVRQLGLANTVFGFDLELSRSDKVFVMTQDTLRQAGAAEYLEVLAAFGRSTYKGVIGIAGLAAKGGAAVSYINPISPSFLSGGDFHQSMTMINGLTDQGSAFIDDAITGRNFLHVGQ